MTDDNDSNQEANSEYQGMVLPEDGVVDLTDKLTGYMTEIELGGLPDIMGQVLDDFLEQCGGMPEDLKASEAFEQITRNQLSVTLAYQVGRLEGRSPQVVRLLIEEAVKKWGVQPVGESPNISDQDLAKPKELVYPLLRRLEYPDPPDDDGEAQ
jgi:hypothetical protein